MQGLTEKIRNILKKLDITTAPIPIEKVADLFLIEIVPYLKFPDNVSGTIVAHKNSAVIGVNQNHSEARQRFTIAHELGHFLLGHEISDKIIDDVFDKPTDKEKEANEFAAELLMPKDLLKVDVLKNRGKMKIPELAKLYKVSEQAMSIRLLTTGLINDL